MLVNVIVPTILIASTSYVQPVFRSNYIEPVVSAANYIEPVVSAANYIEPVVSAANYIESVFETNYLQIQVAAEVTMPDVLSVDIVTPVDLVSLSTTKTFSDITDGFTDAILRIFDKSFADSASSTDLFARSFQKNLVEIQALADAKQISLFKVLADSTSPADLASLNAVKALADTISSPTDSVANAIHKVFADSVTLTDFAQIFKTYIRSFNEALTTPDLSSNFFESGTPADQATVADQNFRDTSKTLVDGLNAIDNMDGDLTYAFVKVIGEMLMTPDLQIIDFSAQKADNMVISSSGFLYMQDYCDITYFLEDYVGQSRTFT
jgi:hypothetical protein